MNVIDSVYRVEVKNFDSLLSEIIDLSTTVEKMYNCSLLIFFILCMYAGFVIGYILSKKE